MMDAQDGLLCSMATEDHGWLIIAQRICLVGRLCSSAFRSHFRDLRLQVYAHRPYEK